MEESMRTEDGGVCREWIALFQEFFGYCLVPSAKAEAILVNVGEGGNGKGVFTKVLTALVGRKQVAALDLKQLGGPHSDYVHASLFGKLVALINEPNRRHMLECGEKLYAISSGDLISARRPTEKVFEYNPYCRLVMSCNQIPATADLTDAIQRRVLPVEWRNKPAVPDTFLVEKLVSELPGILNWALDGLDRLRERGWKFAIPEESRRLRDDYLKSQDSAALFLDAECETDPESRELWCVPADLHRVYVEWCRKTGYQPLNICEFGKHLTKRLGYRASRSRKIEGRVIDVRYGIRIVSSPYRETADLDDFLRKGFSPQDHL
jgi:putative DNA primase/helicase